MAVCVNCGQELELVEKALILSDDRLKVCLACEAKAKADVERLDGVPVGSYSVKYKHGPLKPWVCPECGRRNSASICGKCFRPRSGKLV